jgi:uncharacterized protein (DUF488 family)
MINLFTIGFCGKKEADFYNSLNNAGVKTLVDIRLWRVSRFVSWANGANLELILRGRYTHISECAPTKELLSDYKNNRITWNEYTQIFNKIIGEREIEKRFSENLIEGACLLCSEKSPEMCHRRLVAEYLTNKFSNIKIEHL